MAPPVSKLWKDFTKKDSKTAVCKLCLREIKYSGNTTNLSKHLKTNHKNLSPKSTSKSDKLKLIQSSASTSTACTPASSFQKNVGLTEEEQEPEKVEKVTPPIMEAFMKSSAYAVGGIRHAKLVNALLYFICKDNRPFAVIEGEGFKHLMHEVTPNFKIPSVKFMKKQLMLKYEAVSSLTKTRLEQSTHISLSSDVWTETMSEKSYLGVTAHFLEGTDIISLELTCKELCSNHTAVYLSKELEKVLADWGIPKEKVVGIVTDNGQNIVAAAQSVFPNKQIPCFAHTLNLVTSAAVSLPAIAGTIKKVREIVKFIKNSVNHSDKLRKIQLDGNVSEGNVSKMILDVKTRWNSTFYMVERFLKLLTVVSQILINEKNSPEMPTAAEIDDLRHLVLLLKPFEYATTEISGQQYVTISKIIPMVNCLLVHVKDFDCNVSPSIIAVKKTLDAEMKKRFGQIEQHSRLAISTLLDPRFKNINFEDATACGSAISKLRVACKSVDSSSSSESEEDRGAVFDFWQAHKLLAHGRRKKSTRSDTSEVTLYLSNPVSPLKTNPLDIWEEMKSVFPSMFKEARKHLVIMGTSVSCERLFSKAGSTINQRRNRLSSKYLDKLIFLGSVGGKEWFR